MGGGGHYGPGGGGGGGHMGQQPHMNQMGGGAMGGQQMGGGMPGQPPIDLNNPMIQMAASSGAQYFDQGQAMLQKNVEQYVSMGLLRHYFSVDTAYVLSKLKILAGVESCSHP
jgi:hypothetical protein